MASNEPTRTVVTRARIFDGQQLTEARTLVVEGACLRDVEGVTDIRSAGTARIGEDGPHAKISGMAQDAVVRNPKEADVAAPLSRLPEVIMSDAASGTPGSGPHPSEKDRHIP